MTISEKVAYLKGLAEGLGLDTEKSKEGKLISVMIGILEEVGLSLEDLEENTTVLGEELDAISDDLSDVEKVIYGDDDETTRTKTTIATAAVMRTTRRMTISSRSSAPTAARI